MIYGIIKIKKLGYRKLDIFVQSIKSLSTIPKIMIIVDSINERMPLTKYLCSKLLDNLKNKVEQVIQYFYSNLSNKSRKLFTEYFL